MEQSRGDEGLSVEQQHSAAEHYGPAFGFNYETEQSQKNASPPPHDPVNDGRPGPVPEARGGAAPDSDQLPVPEPSEPYSPPWTVPDHLASRLPLNERHHKVWMVWIM